jgi:hypothetical protein
MNEPHETMLHFPSNRASLYAPFGGGGGRHLVAARSPSKSRAN